MDYMVSLSSALNDMHGLFLDPGAGGAPRTPQGFELDPGWQVAERELLAIERLRDDWDGMGARAPDPKVVESAFVFLDSLRKNGDSLPPESISASPRGRVVFSWHNNSAYFEAEIVDPTRISFLLEFPGGEISNWTIDSATSVGERTDVRLDKTLVESSYLCSRLYRFNPSPQNELWGQE